MASGPPEAILQNPLFSLKISRRHDSVKSWTNKKEHREQAMVTRKHPRYNATIPSILTSRDRRRHATSLCDVSIKGCRVSGPMDSYAGMQVEVSLQLPGNLAPIVISNATVRWTGANGIGIEFLQVAPEQLERLSNLLTQLEPSGGI